MTDKDRPDDRQELCKFTPANDSVAKDPILKRRPRTMAELKESAQKCMELFDQRLTEIEEKIKSGSDKDN